MTQPEKRKALTNAVLTVFWTVWLLVISVITLLQTNGLHANAATLIWWSSLSWYEDSIEVVNRLNFVQSWDQSSEWNVSEMYADWEDTLVVTSKPIITESAVGENANELGSDVNSQIIWWAWVNVWADNITIIWWNANTVAEWNDSATVLWWKSNTLSWNDWTPAVLVGWAGNEISNTEWWMVIVGWSWNKISGWSNSQILWWEGNIIEANNALVAWSNVNNTWADNSFVFSDSSFTPESSGAFYINTDFGLWLNADSASWGITSAWWISLWEIDIRSNACSENNIGVQWVYTGCLVWCTTWWSADGKWDLLETSTRCIDWCDSDDLCIDTIKTFYESFTGFCNLESLWSPLKEKVKSCWELYPGLYVAGVLRPESFKDVMFDIDFVSECPSGDTLYMLSNPCVYVCPEWYTMSEWACYPDCKLPWDETITVPYWRVIEGYSQTSAECASGKTCDDYKGKIKCDANASWNAVWTVIRAPIWVSFIPSNVKSSCSLITWSACPSEYNLTSTGMEGALYSGCTEYTTVSNTQCNAVTKYKFNGCDTAAWYRLINGVCVASCINPFNWSTMLYGESVTWYKQATISCEPFGTGTSCAARSETLTCGVNLDSALSSYPNSWCRVTEVNAVSTEFNLTECPKARSASWTLAPGMVDGVTEIWYCTIKTWYRVSDDGQSCILYHMYRLDWCIPWYHTWTTLATKYMCLPDCILPWSTAWLQYWVSNPAWSSNTDRIVRSGSYKWYKTTSQQCPNVVIWSNTYNESNWWLDWCENADNWANMTCLANGFLSGGDTYKQQTCVTQPDPYPPEYNRTAEVANAVCVSYQPYSVIWNKCKTDDKRWRCTECKSWYTINSTGYTKLINWDTSAKCLKDCSFEKADWTTQYLSWWNWSATSSIRVYEASSYTCPSTCEAHTEIWSCNDGIISRNLIPSTVKPYLSCTQTATRYTPAEVNDWTQTWVRTIVKNWSGAHGIANVVNGSVSGRSNPYKYYLTWTSPECKWDKTYYYLKCDINNWYVWSTNSNTCVRCEGSYPSNWQKNNEKYPTTSSITYCYSEDSSATCSFSCKDWKHWVASSTGNYYKCGTSEKWDCVDWYCYVEWEPTLHTTSKKIFRWSSNPICNNECDGVIATCKYGKWMVGSTELTWTLYNSCATRNWYVVTYPSTLSPVAGSYNPTTGTYEKVLTSQPANTILKEKAINYTANSLSCTTGNTYFKVECPSADYYWTGNLCQKYCVWLDWAKYKSWQTLTTYASSSKTCPNTCSTATATCKSNGSWSRTLYSSCSTTDYVCDSSYTLSSCPSNCDCSGDGTCTPYSWGSAGNCTAKSKKYKIIGPASSNYYVNGNTCSAVCAPSSSTPCNGGYTANGTVGSSSYTCTSWSNSASCSCGSNVWDGSKCAGWWATCGTADWQTLSSKPSTVAQKCSVWTGSDVTTNTWTWTWTCSGVSAKVNCSAYRWPSCWSAHGYDYCEAPTQDLCDIWTNDGAETNDLYPWKYVWFCYNGSKRADCFGTIGDDCGGTTVDWICGTADWQTLSSKPSTSAQKCSQWTASTVQTNTWTWTWTCSGDTPADCSTYIWPSCWSAAGKTYTSAPTSWFCSVWVKSAGVTTDTTNNLYKWTCQNGWKTQNCTANIYVPVDGACGGANGKYYSTTPNSDLCSAWIDSSVDSSSTTWYKWTCAGDTTANCSAYKNAVCGSANGGTHNSAPSSSLCSIWTGSSVTTNTSTYTWTCKNYASTAYCTGYKPTEYNNCTTSDSVTIAHWTTFTGYTSGSGSVQCTSSSSAYTSLRVKCDDGSFYKVSDSSKVTTVYYYCSTKDYTCNHSVSTGYTISWSCPTGCICNDSCQEYSWSSAGSCTAKTKRLKITGATWGYYVKNSSSCEKLCNVNDSDGCNGTYTWSGTLRSKWYKCNWYTCDCTDKGSKYRWDWSACGYVDDPCVNTASNPRTNGCSAWIYKTWGSYTSWTIWNCVDASGTNLNSEVCHKCNTSNGFEWNSSSKKCACPSGYEYISNKCRQVDHYEWRFERSNGTPITYVEWTVWTQNSGEFEERAKIFWVYLSWTSARALQEQSHEEDDDGITYVYESTDHLTFWNNSYWNVDKWWWNIEWESNISAFTNSSFYSTYDVGTYSKKARIDLTNFYRNGIPVMNGTYHPNVNFSSKYKFLQWREITVSFPSSQPTVSRVTAPSYETTRNLYGYMIRWWVRDSTYYKDHEGCLYGIEPVNWEDIVAVSTPIYESRCTSTTYDWYYVSQLYHWETSSRISKSWWCKAKFYCNDGSLSKTSESCSSSGWWNTGWDDWCFVEGTSVLTDEWYKNIEDINTGDMVLTYSPRTQKYEYNRVIKKYVHENNDDELYEITINGEVLKVTYIHRFYVKKDSEDWVQCKLWYDWIEAKDLREWDMLLMYNGDYGLVENISHHSNYWTVYNLWIENVRDYFVGEWYLVHNSVDLEREEKFEDGLMPFEP